MSKSDIQSSDSTMILKYFFNLFYFKFKLQINNTYLSYIQMGPKKKPGTLIKYI